MGNLNRREFLSTAAAAGALLGVRPLAAEQSAPTNPRRLLKTLKYGMIAEGATVLEKFTIARRCGFSGVELDSPSDLKLDEVLAARDATGLVIPGVVDSVHWSKTLADPDLNVRHEAHLALEQALRDCHALGGTSVLLVPAVVSARVSYAEAYTRSQAEIRKALPLAQELGVQIAIENVWNNFLLSPLEAARYVDEIDPSVVGWHFDVGNVVAFGWPEQWIRTLGHRIIKLDIKDYSRVKRDEQGLPRGFDVEIGEGDSGWPAVRRALEEIGYEGWACAEVAGGDEARLRDVAQRMDNVFSL